MAKQSGIFKIEGTLDDVTFYKEGDTFRVRRKGGVSRQRIMNDPAFARTRENGTEFTNVAHSSAMLRYANGVMIRKAPDGKLNRRLMSVLTRIKNLDLVSTRGSRNVYAGLQTADGRQVLKGFDFNSRAQLRTVLNAPFTLDTATGAVTIIDLVPREMLAYPMNATHVTFKTCVLDLAFNTGDNVEHFSPEVNLPLDMTVSSPVMTPVGFPVQAGTLMYQLLIEFTQEINGVQYPLHDGKFNVLQILEVL